MKWKNSTNKYTRNPKVIDIIILSSEKLGRKMIEDIKNYKRYS